MKPSFLIALCLTLFTVPLRASGQAIAGSSFYEKAQQATSNGKSFTSVNFTATAEWIAGSLHESGTATLQAKIDGSTNVQLDLGHASRNETQSSANASRTCTWTDAAGISHSIVGPNCLIAIPWFAPALFAQSSPQLPSMLAATDDGEMSRASRTLHQFSYRLKFSEPDSTDVDRLTSMSTVKVLYDPQTALPASLEYFIHPDNNDLQNLPVQIVFSGYQPISGIMLPFHIERYVNRTLQLTLDITNVSIE